MSKLENEFLYFEPIKVNKIYYFNNVLNSPFRINK